MLTAGDGPLALGVSGGSDSTALLLLAHDWASSRNRQLVAATLDHGLRPEAAAEAEEIARLCKRIGVHHDTLRWRPAPGPVSMAAARRARHALLAAWAQALGAQHLALGHTQDDRVETFLMRARAGSDWWGLAGPMPSAPSPAWPEGQAVRIVRPLLWARREQLRDWLRLRNESWIEDPTNDNPRHERTRMRRLAACLPPEVRARLAASLDRLAALRAAQLAAIRDLAAAALSLDHHAARLDADLWRAASAPVRERLLGYVIVAVSGTDAPLRGDRLKALADRLALDSPCAATLGGAKIESRDGLMRLRPAPPRRGASPRAIEQEPGAAPRLSGLIASPHIETLATPAA